MALRRRWLCHLQLSFWRLGLVLVAAGAALSGCKEDPPPPPLPATDANAQAKAIDPALSPAPRRDSREIPRISAQAMKEYRVETCYFGSMGILYARDAYLKSLGGAAPSADKLPSFGDYPETKAPRGTRDEHMVRLPFLRHVRSCGIAKNLKNPEDPDLAAAIDKFNTYITKLNKNLSGANAYYGREQHKKDENQRGLTLHKELTEAFPALEAELRAFGTAVEAWRAKLEPAPDPLAEGGKLATVAVADARALAVALLASTAADGAGEVKPAAVDEALGKLAASSEALAAWGKTNRTATHPRMLDPKLEAMAKVAKAARASLEGKALSSEHIHKVSAAIADLIETHHRALARSLRTSGEVTARPSAMRLLKPSARARAIGTATQPIDKEPNDAEPGDE